MNHIRPSVLLKIFSPADSHVVHRVNTCDTKEVGILFLI